MQAVTFSTGHNANGFSCQLEAETANTIYTIVHRKDQLARFMVNYDPYAKWPNSRVPAGLKKVYMGIRNQFDALLALPYDGPEYRAAWWAIKDQLKDAEV